MRWSVTTAPTGTVLTWDQLKAHLNRPPISQQTYIMSDLLPSAVDYAETMMECALLPQTITAIYDQKDIGWYSSQFNYFDLWEGKQGWELPRGPVIGITSVTDANGNPVSYARHTVGNAEFVVPTQGISFTQTPITVVYQAGFTIIPQAIVNAIRVHVATMFMVREDVTNLPANAIHKIEDFYRYRGRGSVVA